MPTLFSYQNNHFWLLRIFILFLLLFSVDVKAHVATNIVVIGSNVDGEGGGSNVALTSSDGIIWTPRSIPTTPLFWNVVLANNKYTVVGQCRSNLISKDGINWIVSPTKFCMRKIIWSHKQYFTLFNDPDTTTAEIFSSTDGISFKSRFIGPDLAVNGIARGKGRYIAVGSHSVNPDPKNQGLILTSSNGSNWNLVDKTFIPGQLYDVIFKNNIFVAVGTNIATSENGITWKTTHSGVSTLLMSVAFGDNKFVAVGQRGVILTSQNGKKWVLESSGTSNDLFNVIWTDNTHQFIAVGSFGTILTSTNGKDWLARNSGTQVSLTGVAGPHLPATLN
jgi:hypothetical protein